MTAKRTPAEIRAAIRDLWPTRSVNDISGRVHLNASRVRAIAAELGLGPNPNAGLGAVPVPHPPRGYTPEELAWARANAGDPEARLMLVHAADRRLKVAA